MAGQLLTHTGVIAQIGLRADNQAGDTGAVVVDLGEPFLTNVFKGRGRSHGEANQEDVGLGVRQGSQAIVILLTGSIEQSKCVGLIPDPRQKTPVNGLALCDGQGGKKRDGDLHDRDRIVVKDRRDIFRGEFVCCV